LNLFGDPHQQFRFEESCEWLTLEPEAGTVGPGDANDVNVTFNAIELVPGTYEAEIIVLSNDPCNPEITVAATMTVTPDDLVVTPAEGFEPNGVRCGPFAPQCTSYTLTNNGTGAVSWMTYPTADWLAVDPYEGVLEPNESVDVNVCITPAADLLDPNVYIETLTFENINSGSIKMRSVVLTVVPPDCFTESFDGDIGLGGLMLTFMPDGSSAYYEACREEISGFPTDPNGATYVPLGDDDFAEVILSGGKEVLFYGSWYDRFCIGSNVYITFGAGDTEYSGTLENHFDMPRISALFTDLTPADNHSISWMQLDDRVVVTFKDVPIYGDKNAKNSFQIEMFFIDGAVCMSWLDIEATSGVAGLSEGYGLPPDLTESILSEYPPCWPFCDLNRDYVVGWPDLGMFVSHWLEADCNIPLWCGRADFDFSGAVDMFDWAVFAESWLLREDWWLQPVSHWKFDEGSGTIAYDSAGNNHGTLYGDPNWVAGKIGSYAIDFDGVNDYVDLGDKDVWDFTGSYTVLAWIYVEDWFHTDWQEAIMCNTDSAGGWRFVINTDYSGQTPGKLVFKIVDGSLSITANQVIYLNNWYHVVAAYDHSVEQMKLYVNATVVSTTNANFVPKVSSKKLAIAKEVSRPTGYYFNGTIDDARIYDRALTAEEIWQLYQSGLD
jgi:hypothetical protein